MTSATVTSAPHARPSSDVVTGRFIASPTCASNKTEDGVAMLSRLLGDAFEIVEHDRGAARTALAHAFALIEARYFQSPAVSRKSELGVLAPWQAKRAAAYIEAHLDTPIRIREMAALTRLSRSYFSRAFKTTFGLAPQPYVQSKRTAQAQAMMLETDEPLCGIALACGFSDQAHFSRVFRRLTGASPNAWRRSQRAGAVPQPAAYCNA